MPLSMRPSEKSVPSERSRVVLDTVVFVRALINPKGRWGRLVFERGASYQLVVSPPVVREVLEVIRRPAVIALYRSSADRDPQTIAAFLNEAETVEIDLSAMPRVSRDRKDDKFLATAVAGGAAFIVSKDNDFLVIGEYEGIGIVDAATFLGVLDRPDDENGRGTG